MLMSICKKELYFKKNAYILNDQIWVFNNKIIHGCMVYYGQ